MRWGCWWGEKESKTALGGGRAPCLGKGEMHVSKDRKVGEKTGDSFSEIAASRRQRAGREVCVCTHMQGRGEAVSDSTAVVFADKSFWRMINV